MNDPVTIQDIERWLAPRVSTVLSDAEHETAALIASAGAVVQEFAQAHAIDLEHICFVAVGSVGRREALAASDLDLVPVFADTDNREVFREHDQALREKLRQALGRDVSKGQALTQPTCLPTLTDAETIGGAQDDSIALTRRVLLLTESVQLAGGLELQQVRSGVLDAYAAMETTAGRHIQSFANDLARYYRTLCIEYKAKVDVEAKDWCTRNMKLRHSRKLWYYSTLLSMASLSARYARDTARFRDAWLQALALPPSLRLVCCLDEAQWPRAASVLEAYCWFLHFMADKARRERLANVRHDERYELGGDNPFVGLKLNSDAMHRDMLALLDEVPAHTRQRVLDLFLL